MFTKEDVTRLIADINGAVSAKKATAPNAPVPANAPYPGNRDVATVAPLASAVNVDLSGLEIGAPYMFGLALDAYDPVSGSVFAVTRPAVVDLPYQSELFLTVGQLATEVANKRMKKLVENRTAGIVADAHPAKSADAPHPAKSADPASKPAAAA